MKMKSLSTILFLSFVWMMYSLAITVPILAQSHHVSAQLQGDSLSKKAAIATLVLSAPRFAPAIQLEANGVVLKVDTYTSVPCVVDWNADGKKDLLVGCFYNGNIYFFNNTGTDSSPVFATGTKLKAGGVDISVAYG